MTPLTPGEAIQKAIDLGYAVDLRAAPGEAVVFLRHAGSPTLPTLFVAGQGRAFGPGAVAAAVQKALDEAERRGRTWCAECGFSPTAHTCTRCGADLCSACRRLVEGRVVCLDRARCDEAAGAQDVPAAPYHASSDREGQP